MGQSKIIANRKKAQQLLAFDDMKWGLCRPTDIDASMDWQCETFLFIEAKTEGAALTVGQRIHLSALCDAIRAGGKHAYAIVARHETPSHQDVFLGTTRTCSVYTEKGWEKVDTNERLNDTLDAYYEAHCARRGIK